MVKGKKFFSNYGKRLIVCVSILAIFLLMANMIWTLPENKDGLEFNIISEDHKFNGIRADIDILISPERKGIYPYEYIKAEFDISVRSYNLSLVHPDDLNDLMLGIYIENAVYYVEGFEGVLSLPELTYFPKEVNSTRWDLDLYLNFQMSGLNMIHFRFLSDTLSLVEDFTLTQGIPVEPWSTEYQIDASRYMMIGALASISIAAVAIVLGSKLDEK